MEGGEPLRQRILTSMNTDCFQPREHFHGQQLRSEAAILVPSCFIPFVDTDGARVIGTTLRRPVCPALSRCSYTDRSPNRFPNLETDWTLPTFRLSFDVFFSVASSHGLVRTRVGISCDATHFGQTHPTLSIQTAFHRSRYGSGRRKLTRLSHTVPRFAELNLNCQNNHEREPWGQLPGGRWATGDETKPLTLGTFVCFLAASSGRHLCRPKFC